MLLFIAFIFRLNAECIDQLPFIVSTIIALIVPLDSPKRFTAVTLLLHQRAPTITPVTVMELPSGIVLWILLMQLALL